MATEESRLPQVFKTPSEKFPVHVPYVNTDPAVVYVVDAVLSFTVLDGAVDVSASLTGPTAPSVSGNTAIVWVRGGQAGKVYKASVLARMASGEELERVFELVVK